MVKALLSEYDTIIAIDRSGSMEGKANGFPSRWIQAREITQSLARLAAEVDDDGITTIFFGGQFSPARDVKDGVNADSVSSAFNSMTPGGSTPMAEALNAAFSKKFSSSKKAVVFVITDGEPNDPSAVKSEIIKAAGKLGDASQLRVLFLQVGDDSIATKYLAGLDSQLSSAKFDIVNTITHHDADGLTPESLYERAITDSH